MNCFCHQLLANKLDDALVAWLNQLRAVWQKELQLHICQLQVTDSVSRAAVYQSREVSQTILPHHAAKCLNRAAQNEPSHRGFCVGGVLHVQLVST